MKAIFATCNDYDKTAKDTYEVSAKRNVYDGTIALPYYYPCEGDSAARTATEETYKTGPKNTISSVSLSGKVYDVSAFTTEDGITANTELLGACGKTGDVTLYGKSKGSVITCSYGGCACVTEIGEIYADTVPTGVFLRDEHGNRLGTGGKINRGASSHVHADVETVDHAAVAIDRSADHFNHFVETN